MTIILVKKVNPHNLIFGVDSLTNSISKKTGELNGTIIEDKFLLFGNFLVAVCGLGGWNDDLGRHIDLCDIIKKKVTNLKKIGPKSDPKTLLSKLAKYLFEIRSRLIRTISDEYLNWKIILIGVKSEGTFFSYCLEFSRKYCDVKPFKNAFLYSSKLLELPSLRKQIANTTDIDESIDLIRCFIEQQIQAGQDILEEKDLIGPPVVIIHINIKDGELNSNIARYE